MSMPNLELGAIEFDIGYALMRLDFQKVGDHATVGKASFIEEATANLP